MPNPPEVTLEKYIDSPENRIILLDYYTQVYSKIPKMANENRFEWQTFLNPLEENEERPLIWLLRSCSGKLCGHNSLLKFELRIDNRKYSGYCSTNLLVNPGTEGKGLGHVLIENNEKMDGVAFAVGITEMASRAFQKRGWVLINDSSQQSLVLNPMAVFGFLNKSKMLAYIASPFIILINAAFRVYKKIFIPRSISDISFSQINEFLPDWDNYWREYLKDYAIHFDRNSSFLNYKYFKREDIKHTVYLFENQNRPIGYIVFRKSVNVDKKIVLGRIVDFVYDPTISKKLLSYMIKIASDELRKLQVDCIVGIASSPATKTAFWQNGFIFSRIQPAIIRETDFKIKDLRQRYSHIWYISLGDSDLDNYW
ncbi:MAG: hypothetical protein V3V99_14790 [candidate division Zixibacteria bacterium]